MVVTSPSHFLRVMEDDGRTAPPRVRAACLRSPIGLRQFAVIRAVSRCQNPSCRHTLGTVNSIYRSSSSALIALPVLRSKASHLHDGCTSL